MSELYMKYAEHGRSARQRATLHSDQQRNHWKTPTGFQCWLPGQHQQKLPTIVAKLQKMMKRAQNNRVEGGDKTGNTINPCWVHFSTMTKERKFGKCVERSSRWWKMSLSPPSSCFSCRFVTRTLQLHHTHTNKHTQRNTNVYIESFCFPWFPPFQAEKTGEEAEKLVA